MIEELIREVYHSLHFSNEESSFESEINAEEEELQRKKKKRTDSMEEKINRIKSFTFEVGHSKLQFSRNDENNM